MIKSISLYPEKDTFVDSFCLHKNYSNNTHYFLGFFKKAIKYRILLKYDLSDIPKDMEIIDAKLKLYCIRNDHIEKAVTLDIHPITEEWDLNTVCYANQPSYDDSKKISGKVQGHLREYINFNLTEYVKQWLNNPNANFGMTVKAENESDEKSLIAILSKKESSKLKPELVVTIKSPELKKRKCGDKTVAILTPQFFQWNSERCLFGGGERYLIYLATLLQDLGYKVDVFQPTNIGMWERSYNGIKIYGITKGNLDMDFFVDLNKEFKNLTAEYNYHIYFNMDLIYPYVFPGSICINHGIWWDATERTWWRSDKWYEYMFTGLDSVDTLVSVDTNTINWINAVRPEIKCNKVFIPNFVDLDIFKLENDAHVDNSKIKVLYPRRLCSARGWDICKEIAGEFTEEYENLTFSFVGRGSSDKIEKHMEIFCMHHPGVEYTWYEMEEMYKAYQGTDIVLIPSLYSEGTSLSLLEAMACGKPVIAGLVGGLTDLVIQGYNGYLIEVNKENLKEAIIKLISDQKLRREMGKNAYNMAQMFSKKIWTERWKKVILETFG